MGQLRHKKTYVPKLVPYILPSSAAALTAGKVFRIGIVHYNWPMSAHASQAALYRFGRFADGSVN